jgi:sugar-specific transcriptional regulator TrmB
MKETLIKIGFSENEAKTYLELLKNNSVTTTFLAKKLNLHRGYIYEILDKLIEKGVVSSIKKNGKKHFEALPPNEILAFIEDEKYKIEKYEQEFREVLPKLNQLKDSSRSKQSILLLEGKKAIRSILEEILELKKPIYVFGAAGKFPQEMENYYFLWNRRRTKNKIPLQIIYNSEELGKKESSFEETEYVSKKYINLDQENPASIMLYDDKVAIVLWVETPVVTLIQSKDAFSMYKKYFDTSWKQAKAFR